MVTEQDYWVQMRRFTAARIGLGRSGVGIPTAALLEFQLAFARARDAVHADLDIQGVIAAAAPAETIAVASQAEDRATYLLRPDLGRRLSEHSAAHLRERWTEQGFDLAFVIGDGLSSRAAERHAPTVVDLCRDGLRDLSIAPLVIASQARVALADDVARQLNARMVMILLGERPGLTTAESLGLYFTWQPRIGTQDSARNCISNVHDNGLVCPAAARMAISLIREAIRLKLSGVGLKENSGQSMLEGDRG